MWKSHLYSIYVLDCKGNNWFFLPSTRNWTLLHCSIVYDNLSIYSSFLLVFESMANRFLSSVFSVNVQDFHGDIDGFTALIVFRGIILDWDWWLGGIIAFCLFYFQGFLCFSFIWEIHGSSLEWLKWRFDYDFGIETPEGLIIKQTVEWQW